ncbi:MAG TPA: PIN domain-containing protein [Candidatus Solibacter sp.]|jgi:predicted nucleic acid-binding protein|nr:PIN domain-containing protein [Candidatus Solibacter sp.]
MSRIYWDTMFFAYLIEANPEHGFRVQEILGSMKRRRDTLCTSIFTIGEVLTGPYKKGLLELASAVKALIRPPEVELLPFNLETSERYARIRAENRVSPADAIHLATAAQAGVNLFLTNDRTLSKLVIPGIDFIAGLDVNLF